MEQADVLKLVEDAGKSAGKSFLAEIAKEGGALEMELDILAAKGGVVAESVEAVVKPLLREAIASLLSKI